ncbi:protein kinase [Streptomyces sp. BB1-1-1]|uniref:protein kinase domain-containing protein n=1 Tax=Streptomyces sp. BB1-1-1 TaxID=3074430 RepID=UPI0028779489|nr:protein kinase [Streptomyces sp. BB1-1-1]WND35605.1 protein kinase [Streptomyces sp. BB1-1-1]
MTGRPYAVPVPKGYRIGPWEVREPLASGAFATVYDATRAADDGELPRRAALKFLATGTRTPRQLHHLRDLAEREVQLLRRLRSPRLIRMYDTLAVDDPDHPELDGATVLVLERAEGSLDAVLARTPSPEAGPALLAQICEGLHQLHHAGWVHGDLKPANVLLMADGSARLADFNLAAEMEGTHAYAPAFATPDYTPPELLWPEVDERGTRIRPSADVWAFGVLAHVVLTGEFPLPGGTSEARSDAATRYARGREELRLSPGLPDAWREIISDCLARTHEERTGRTAGTASLLRRVERVAGTSPAARLPRLRPYRLRRTARVSTLVAVALAAVTASTMYAAREDDEPTYGYHRCPVASVCFFSEPNGAGEMCSWDRDDGDWLSGADTCLWTRDRPVRSIFNNSSDDSTGLGAVAYFRGRDFTPVGEDVTRKNSRNRTGCTSQRNQGNLAGTYAPLSHKWIARC